MLMKIDDIKINSLVPHKKHFQLLMQSEIIESWKELSVKKKRKHFQ